ncbi:hypothetical protein [Actinomadura rubrisoli]|uniref:hypothetical protein n=1 Tax=Actinomadura rubrisoli TaxID=2530368 RepID=UPI001A9DC559|nr:hypothetical protein [Actinomadura rubrisoli]
MAEKTENVVDLLVVAPTHPHQGTESPMKNLAVGPFAAVVDRARDAIGKARH